MAETSRRRCATLHGEEICAVLGLALKQEEQVPVRFCPISKDELTTPSSVEDSNCRTLGIRSHWTRSAPRSAPRDKKIGREAPPNDLGRHFSNLPNLHTRHPCSSLISYVWMGYLRMLVLEVLAIGAALKITNI